MKKKQNLDLNNKREGSYWFNRFRKDCEKMSSHIKFRRIKMGFYRIYWTGGGEPAYIGECYKEMPEVGYEWYDVDPRLESQKYHEEWEDSVELTRKIKNFVEGYWETLDRIRTRVYMLKHNKEFYQNAVKGYRQMVVK